MKLKIIVDDSEWHDEDHERNNFKDEVRYALEDIYANVEYIEEIGEFDE